MFCKLVGPLNIIWVNLLLCFQQILQPPLAFFYNALWLRITVPTRHFFTLLFGYLLHYLLSNVYSTLSQCLQNPLADVYNTLWPLLKCPLVIVYNTTVFTTTSGQCLQYHLAFAQIYKSIWPAFTMPSGQCLHLL